jgi:flagellar FliJ protein
MKRSKRLQRVSELGVHEEHRAGKALAAAREAQAGAQQMLEQLRGYREEYQQLFEQQRLTGMDPVRYGNFQRFFEQLDRAIAEQRSVLATSEQRVQQQQTLWMKKRQDAEIMSKLTGRLTAEELHADDKREQKQADEFSSRRYSRS